jgi:hypothetical protein
MKNKVIFYIIYFFSLLGILASLDFLVNGEVKLGLCAFSALSGLLCFFLMQKNLK